MTKHENSRIKLKMSYNKFFPESNTNVKFLKMPEKFCVNPCSLKFWVSFDVFLEFLDPLKNLEFMVEVDLNEILLEAVTVGVTVYPSFLLFPILWNYLDLRCAWRKNLKVTHCVPQTIFTILKKLKDRLLYFSNHERGGGTWGGIKLGFAAQLRCRIQNWRHSKKISTSCLKNCTNSFELGGNPLFFIPVEWVTLSQNVKYFQVVSTYSSSLTVTFQSQGNAARLLQRYFLVKKSAWKHLTTLPYNPAWNNVVEIMTQSEVIESRSITHYASL